MYRIILLIITIIYFILVLQSAYADVVLKVEDLKDGGYKDIYLDNNVSVCTQKYDENGVLLNQQGHIPDGIVKFYPESGGLWEVSYKDDKRNGITKVYNNNGTLSSESNWKNDKRNGITKVYNNDGTLSSESSWEDDKQNGIEKMYFNNGLLMSEKNYKNGKLNGIYKAYRENGTLISASNWKDGNGIVELYDEYGNLQYKDTYKNDKKTNRKAYSPEGKLLWSQDY